MRNVDATIEQAKALGSEDRLMLHEIVEIQNRTIKGYGKFSAVDLICDAYNFGFALGYRAGQGKRNKADA